MSKVCFISGSSRGIGLAIALDLAKAGHQVILNSRKPIEDQVLALFEDCDLVPGQAIGDIADFDQSEQMVKAIQDQYGPIQVLINNAGITKDGLFMRMSESDFDQVLATNLKGSFNLCRHVIGGMVKAKGGTIINMSSVVGVAGNPGQANYAASKAGLIGLTKSLAKEVGSRAIRVNAIAPGFIETEMTDNLGDRQKEAMLASIPLKRFGHVDEIAHAVRFLMENTYVTGQVLEINGGMNM
ncbi:TPA: 3-oxoacyl-[acyl-carrier-protein] reductase [Streptococcus suis]